MLRGSHRLRPGRQRSDTVPKWLKLQSRQKMCAAEAVVQGETVSNPTDNNPVREPAPSASATPPINFSTSVRKQRTQLFTRHPIGSKLEAIRRELIVCGQELQGTAPFQGRPFFNDTLARLIQLTCRIAVIGQVKAGKSSFINAFVGRPGLLPTDINPWTTAVTHLHFGNPDAPPDTAAQFTFFAPDEWEQLTHGGGRIRELTQRLVPGFEVELLEKHVQAMRQRSEARLGSALGDLLGKRHEFPELSAEILERYVCSGSQNRSGELTEQNGIYSDIVKTADLYFNSNDFGIPTTIIDTPGTNDPLLVRDEITRRALEAADIYIVMLTARQALSSADVALLRILRGLHKDRIVVFINRIDELGDVPHDTPLIVQHVRAGLRREFPTFEIPVIAGSAFWAKTALVGSDADIGRVLSKKVKAYAADLAQHASPLPSSLVKDGREENPAQTLLLCSGFSALADVLSDLTFHSHAGHILKQACRSFTELGEVGRDATQQAITIVETEGRASVSRQRQGEEELRTIDAEVRKNEQLTLALQGLLVDLRASMDKAVEEHCARMREVLQDAVVGFSDVECDNLRRAIVDGHRARVWQCETSSLRRHLEECFVISYRAATEELNQLEAHIFPQLQQLLIRHDRRWRRPDDTGNRSLAAELPSLGVLSQIVALDLEEPWWRRWWTSSSGREAQIGALDHLIRHEFQPIVDTLVQAARTHLKARQVSALQKSTLVYMGLVEFLQEQNRARLARTRVLLSAGDAFPKTELAQKREARIADLKQEIPIIDALLHRLRNVNRTWSEGWTEAGVHVPPSEQHK